MTLRELNIVLRHLEIAGHGDCLVDASGVGFDYDGLSLESHGGTVGVTAGMGYRGDVVCITGYSNERALEWEQREDEITNFRTIEPASMLIS